MTVLRTAFTNTAVQFQKSMDQIEALLEDHGVREQRYTHLKPADPEAPEGEEAVGRIVYEFVSPATEGDERRGVRLMVQYQPVIFRRDKRSYQKRPARGTTAKMASRALFWLLKSKFDSIDYGIEEFDVAFMPHLMTQLGTTFADQPELIAQAMEQPESISQLALPAPRVIDA